MGIIGVVIDHDNDYTTRSTPHKKVTIGSYTHYFAQLPAGDWMRHVHDSGNERGYCGGMVEFLLEDGTTESVKGPFQCCGSLSHDSYYLESLIDVTGMEELRTMASKITVGRRLLNLANDGPEIIYQEDEMSIIPIADRLLPEWNGLELKIQLRGETKYSTVGEYI